MERVRGFGRPLFVLTGGDPLKRPDTVELVEHGTRIGLRVAMTPLRHPADDAGGRRARLADAGLARLRHLPGRLDAGGARPLPRGGRLVGLDDPDAARRARAGLSTQVNTSISRHNLDDLEPLIALMGELGIALWSVFFLVPTGRARARDIATPGEFEAVFNRLYDLSKTAPFDIKSTAAPQYRRVALGQRQVSERRVAEGGKRAAEVLSLLRWNGGGLNSSGVGLADIDWLGNVAPGTSSG